MKRHGNLWPQIVTWDNLLLAARYAQKGKRLRDNVLEFNYNLETNIFKLQAELRDKTYSNFSPSSGFEVFLYLLLFVNIECYEIEPGKLKLSRYNKSQRT